MNDLFLSYPDASVTSFKPKNWKEGYTLNALLHAFKPELFRYSDLKNMNDVDRLAHALRHAEESFDVHALFTAEGTKASLFTFFCYFHCIAKSAKMTFCLFK